MAARRPSFWEKGPAKWVFTAYGILLASVHLALAGFNIKKFFDLFDVAWPFYASLIGITSTAAVMIHKRTRNRSIAETLLPQQEPYAPHGAIDEEEEEESPGMPRSPR